MDVTESELNPAQQRMAETQARARAVFADYDPNRGRIGVVLDSGLELAFAPEQVAGLAGADAAALAEIEISPAGLGLHWQRLDADVYLPALLGGLLGSQRWMAQQFGRAGGRATSPAKTAAARLNGRKGGRPRKRTINEAPRPK